MPWRFFFASSWLFLFVFLSYHQNVCSVLGQPRKSPLLPFFGPTALQVIYIYINRLKYYELLTIPFSLGEYDLVVIGGGPGGYVAAIKAAQLGLKVLVFFPFAPFYIYFFDFFFTLWFFFTLLRQLALKKEAPWGEHAWMSDASLPKLFLTTLISMKWQREISPIVASTVHSVSCYRLCNGSHYISGNSSERSQA